ncbi:hypothetical protein F5878DRAFT_710841 [Lentinula raphanica]|uniref:DUF6534 domain-containing protein n=1 Tax=Lentinula raphanica TaxID=153919 RepID=A0AA38UGJ4_9AGAR|nr:hypothetical protein F5878DRAFT_710841 [Lentinula raphanica]
MPPAPAAPPHIPTVVEVYTPFVIGAFLNIFLYGIAVSQMYTYYRTSKRDDFWLKLLVFYLFVFDTFNSICDIGLVFESLLLKFGDPGIVATSPWTLRLDGISTTLVSTPVQVYMAWRIRKITKMNIPAAIICVFALASLIGSIWLTIAVSNTPQFAKFNSFRAAPSLWLISSAIADIMIAVCLVYGLSKNRSGRKDGRKTLGFFRRWSPTREQPGPAVGFAVNDWHIDRIIRTTVATGTLTAVTALADVILFLSKPDTTIFFAWDLMLCKMYTTTLLLSLNARPSSRHAERDQEYEPNALGFSSVTSSQLSFNQNTSRSSRYVPKPSGEDLDEQYELSSRTLSPLRREQNRYSLRNSPAGPSKTEFNVLVSQSTVNDSSGEAIYPPPKTYSSSAV